MVVDPARCIDLLDDVVTTGGSAAGKETSRLCGVSIEDIIGRHLMTQSQLPKRPMKSLHGARLALPGLERRHGGGKFVSGSNAGNSHARHRRNA